MGQAKIKAVSTPDISVLIPSRGRPEMLKRCLASLGVHKNVEILVGLDDDDVRLCEYRPRSASATYFTNQRFPTLGACINNLAKCARGKWLFCLGDDHVIDAPDWPQKILDGTKQLPRGIGVVYPKCEHHPNFPSLPIISRKTYEAVGYYMDPHFPHWFLDTWWDEVGIMMSAIYPLDLAVRLPDGKGSTHGLVDLEFWLRFFEATRPIRAKDAMTLATLAYDEGSPYFSKLMQEFPQRLQVCEARVAHLHDTRLIAEWEAKTEDAPSARYAEVKAQAEYIAGELDKQRPRRLRVAIAVPSGRSWEAGTGTDVAALCTYSSLAGIELMILNMQTSMVSMSRNNTVELAMKDRCDYIMWIDSDMRFSPSILVDLLSHEKDIVGCIYNKRVPPYDTLGKLKGPKPPDDVLARGLAGLHEAALLPGGLILVKMDVYRKIGWPAYAETYHWAGKDGMDTFKRMARDYFWKVPSDEVLASIEGTTFGDWITENYRMGENGEIFSVFSEDFFFCRKARRAGFEIWADISSSFSVKHLGVLEVTCEPAPKQEIAEAAE